MPTSPAHPLSRGLLHDFARVSKSRPCPVCEHADWCMISRDDPPSRVICARIESSSRWGDAGWLHRLRDVVPLRPRTMRTVRTVPALASRVEMDDLARQFCAAVQPCALARHAAHLGVGVGSLQRLNIGWTGRAWSFPMRNAAGAVVGIRLRTEEGRKFAITGSSDGIFIPDRLSGRAPLLIAEGPSDTAALLDRGFDVIGRPSCRGGTVPLLDWTRAHAPSAIVVVSDREAVGQSGAADLARRLRTCCRDVRVIVPPCKDAREWIRMGATTDDLCSTIAAAMPVRLQLHTRSSS